MYLYKTTVTLGATDASGFLYFTELPRLGEEAFEAFLLDRDLPLAEILKGEFHLPVVHVEADFSSPLSVSDALQIHLELVHVGKSSFRLRSTFFRKEILAGKVEIVHVAVSRKTGKSIDLPEKIREILLALQDGDGSASAPELLEVEENISVL